MARGVFQPPHIFLYLYYISKENWCKVKGVTFLHLLTTSSMFTFIQAPMMYIIEADINQVNIDKIKELGVIVLLLLTLSNWMKF